MAASSASAAPSPLLARAGAVPAAGPDAGVAAHYGDPLREQRELVAGRAAAELGLATLSVGGPDRLSWLNSLTTQLLLGLHAGDSRETLILDPHGRVEHAAAVLDDGERTWLVTEAANAAALAAFLDSMRFMLRVDVRLDSDLVVLGTTTAGLEELRSAAPRAPVWEDPWPTTGPDGARYGPPDESHPGAEVRFAQVLVPRDELVAVLDRFAGHGGGLAGTAAWEALRVAACRPRLGREVDDRSIPHELDWLRTAVHLRKGCYRGQETVARVVNLGRPPRRLVLLHLDGSEHVLPDAGAELLAGERTVGRITSAALHHEAGPLALAVVRRTLPLDAPLTVDGIAASQVEVVAAEGASTARPPERTDAPDISSLRRRPGG